MSILFNVLYVCASIFCLSFSITFCGRGSLQFAAGMGTHQVQQLAVTDSDYPESLRASGKAPAVIYYIGNLPELLKYPRLAIVGARKVTPYGRAVTHQLAYEAAAQGIVIVSGLAFGVDALAHNAALQAHGGTIAVLASGIDVITPSSHHQLAQDIVQGGGAIISEYPIGSPVYRGNFVARNRIVSGISDGVLITEAAAKSGSIHTANFALDQGRTVMAVPGNITSQMSEGTNLLIKSGATPVTSVRDILIALGHNPAASTQQPVAANPQEAVILDGIVQGTSDIGELQLISGLEPAVFNQTLTMLEITGKIRPLGAGHWSIA